MNFALADGHVLDLHIAAPRDGTGAEVFGVVLPLDQLHERSTPFSLRLSVREIRAIIAQLQEYVDASSDAAGS